MRSYLLGLWESGKLTIKVNLITLIKLARKIMKWRKQHLINAKDMCLSWFKRKPVEEIVYGDRTALLFGINDYPGTVNDLNGCLNDIDDVAAKIKVLWPDMAVHKFKDGQVTRARFKAELAKAIEALPEGGTVVIFTDSCFSAGNTRSNPHLIKPRFMPPEVPSRRKRRRRVFRSVDMKWLAFSGCGEKQTSSDAFFNNRPNGAFTFFAEKCLNKITYGELISCVDRFLPSDKFPQDPELHGPDHLKSRVIGEGPTLIVWYSGHGSYVTDFSGDEVDGVDETLYVYDGHVKDYELTAILISREVRDI